MALPVFINDLLASYQAAPSADNSQPCHMDWAPPTFVIRYDTDRVSGLTFSAESQATLLAAGAAIENVTQCCAAAGVNYETVYFPKAGEGGVFAEITLDSWDKEVDENQLANILSRHTNRFPYKKTAIPQAVVDVLSEVGLGARYVGVKILQDKSDILAIADQVQTASEIRFQTKEVHEWLGKSLRLTSQHASCGDGLDVATLGLPPGGKGFLRFISSWSRMKKLNWVGGYKILAGIEGALVKKSPAVVAITAESTPTGALEAGRVLCQVWNYLNAQGIACHPYYVISDQLERLEQGSVPVNLVGLAGRVRKDCRQLLELEKNATLMMLLRIGFPAKQVPRSQRLPSGHVFTDLSGSE